MSYEPYFRAASHLVVWIAFYSASAFGMPGALGDADPVQPKEPKMTNTTQIITHRFCVTTHSSPKITRGWENKNWSIDDIAKKLTTHRVQKIKEGPCFVPGKIIGNERKATAVEQLDLLVYDVDGGQSYDEVKQILDATNIAYVLYTSYSHLTTETEIKTDLLENWALKNGFEKTHDLHLQPGCVEKYLEEKGRREIIGEFQVEKELRRSAEGLQVVIRHRPLEKFRVALPMIEPFRLQDHGFKDKDQQQAWKRYYTTIGEALGLAFDRACIDVPRPFYLPSHPAGQTPRSIAVIKGRDFIDYRNYEPKLEDADPVKEKSTGTKAPRSNTGTRGRKTNGTSKMRRAKGGARLTAFLAQYGRTFDMPEFLREIASDYVNGDRPNGGVFILCPFEDEHSEPSRTRTYVTPPTDEFGFGIFCSGNACAERKDRLIYLEKMIADGWFTIDDLFDPQFGGGPLEKDFVKTRLAQDSAFAMAALLKLYEMQSSDEREGGATIERNDQGFNLYDGEALSKIAEKYKAGTALSPGDLSTVKKRISKYHKQVSGMLEEVESLTTEVGETLDAESLARSSSATDLPKGYYRDGDIIMTTSGFGEKEIIVEVCQDFEVLAATLTLDDDAKHGIGISFVDRLGKRRDLFFNQGELAGKSDGWLVKLADAGFLILHDLKMRDLLRRLKTDSVGYRATKCGWHVIDGSRVFALPETTIGDADVRFVGDGPEWRAAGTLQEWQNEIARFAVGNHRLMFAISSAFAGPLLKPLNVASGGALLYGVSSEGKSTLLKCAASVWGPKVINMNATKVGVEALLVRHNDTFAPFDELGQMDKGAGEIAYMLGNESGRARGKTDGELRQVKTFKTFSLMTGEQKLADKIEAEGKTPTAGQEVRILTIAANAGGKHGCFEDLHDERNGARLSDRLVDSVSKQHGTAGPAFVAWVLRNYDVLESLSSELGARASKLVPANADGQVHRAAQRCLVVGFAGEMAILAGLVPWPKGAAREAALQIFTQWLDERGGAKSSEALLGKERILNYMRTQPARFTMAKEEPNHRSGFVDRTEAEENPVYYWYPHEFKRVCGSCAPEAVARLLLDEGCLVTDGDKRLKKRKRFDGQPPSARYYAVRLPAEDEDQECSYGLTQEQILAGLNSTLRELAQEGQYCND